MAQNAQNRPALLLNENEDINKEVSNNFVDVREKPVRTNPTTIESKWYVQIKTDVRHINQSQPVRDDFKGLRGARG